MTFQCIKSGVINFINLMSQPTNSKNRKRQYYSITKSNTALNLPGISRMIPNKQAQTRINSSYLDALGTIASPVEYQNKNTVYLNKEQHKLKGILKKINEDAMTMIDSVKPKMNTHKSTRQQLNNLAEKQINSSKKMITNLQYDMQLLKEKYVKIVDNHEYDQLVKRVRTIKQEIEQLRSQNSGTKLSIHRGGNQIVKEYSDLMDIKMNNLQSENYLTNIKAEKLRSDYQRTVQEIGKIEVKLKDTEPKINELETQWNQNKSTYLEGELVKHREYKYQQRKFNLQSLRKKMNYQFSQQQYKYYKLLKDLEYQNASCQAIDSKIDDINLRIANGRQQFAKIDAQHRQIRRIKKRRHDMAEEYLINQKNNKSTYINQPVNSIPLFQDNKQAMSQILKTNQMQKMGKDWVSQQQSQMHRTQALKKEQNLVNQVNGLFAQQKLSNSLQDRQQKPSTRQKVDKQQKISFIQIQTAVLSKVQNSSERLQKTLFKNDNITPTNKNV